MAGMRQRGFPLYTFASFDCLGYRSALGDETITSVHSCSMCSNTVAGTFFYFNSPDMQMYGTRWKCDLWPCCSRVRAFKRRRRAQMDAICFHCEFIRGHLWCGLLIITSRVRIVGPKRHIAKALADFPMRA